MSTPPQFKAPTTEELQQLLPAYDVLSFIAKGGMGAVYKAHQKSLERNVAIKILPREFGEDHDFRRRFEDEAKAMAKLNHPNLISVYDFGEVDHMLYIVMEFVDGKSFHESFHGRAIAEKEVAHLVAGICEGLAHAHEAGILHRDIKPANILLDSKNRPKIGDFGLARLTEETEGEGIIYGTPDYIAPEVIKNPGAVDTRSDVFSTGVILYELLTGKLPEKRYIPASQIEDVDPRFDKIVRRATHPSPMLRFADGEAMASDLKTLQEALDNQVTGIVTAPPAGMATPITGTTPPPAHAAGPQNQPPISEASPPEAAPAAAPEVQVNIGTNWSLLRNLVIIVVLLAAIFGMYRAYQWQKEENAKQQAKQQRLTDQAEADERQRVLEEKRNRERLEALRAAQPKPVPVAPEPEPETPLEALERLKPSLTSGEARTEYPPNTLIRGTSRFFLIEQELSWQRASSYAEEYGGHLAVCLNEGEQKWLSSKIPANTTIWLGGGATGRTAWGWVDGSPWTVRSPSLSTGNTATLSDLGSIRSRPSGETFPFFIQWRHDGTNPGTLESQIARLKASLNSPEPIYPAGVVSFENRRYLVIENAKTWNESNAVAQSAHGHLAVPSEKSEDTYLRSLISRSLGDGRSAWIGGRHNGRAWAWITGETWAFSSWAQDAPDGDAAVESAVKLLAGENGGWDDQNPEDHVEAFVIEWSKDRGNTAPATPASGTGDWASQRATFQKKIRTLEDKFGSALLENGKGLKSDLNFWLRGLRSADGRAYKPTIDQLKANVSAEGVIPLTVRDAIKLPLSPRGVDLLRKRIEAQQALKEAVQAQANQIRQAYIGTLKLKQEAATKAGNASGARAILNEINACGATGRAFLEHLGSGVLDTAEGR
ncbi:MAG TPA: hypothetical protein DCQ96_12360 [Verrucomicrobiales bacterium]|nr:hypothetical protein [Verrucomicrobiales bacterium]